jgi:hypothetical protein
MAHVRELVDEGQRREDVAALLNVDHNTLYRGCWLTVSTGRVL